MPHTLSQILPSLESLGIWAYWIIGAASLLEAYFATGVFVPGTLVVDAGGILISQGSVDFFDLMWFVAIGSIIGGELGYWTGRLAKSGLNTRWNPEGSKSYQKAEQMFRRYGGMALVIGRFFGPVSGLVPFVAAIAGMERRRFVIWNIVSGFPYAIGHLAFGYFLGRFMSRIGPVSTRTALFAAGVLAALAILLWIIWRIERKLPFLLSVLRQLGKAISDLPVSRAWAERHPKAADTIAHRFDASRFSGLTATLLTLLFLYILGVWVASAQDFLMTEPIVQIDGRLANLIHAFWTPWLLRGFAYVTALGYAQVVVLTGAAVVALLWVRQRPDLIAGLLVSALGNSVTVSLLKRIFDRARPELAYFRETSGSFPSGHAAISVAFWAMLFFIAYRLGRLGPLMAALLAATLAFVIGLSRLYLLEHFLTDVLNGWLTGALWLVIGIAVAEWMRDGGRLRLPEPSRGLRMGLFGASAVFAALALWQVTTFEKARNIPVATASETVVKDVPALIASGKLPIQTDSLTGDPMEPINVALLAPNEAALPAEFRKAGWDVIPRPSLSKALGAAFAALFGDDGDGTDRGPSFWQGAPYDLALGTGATEVRLWRTSYVTPDGRRLFVGTASQLQGRSKAKIVDPRTDAARNKLTSDLAMAGDLAAHDMVPLPHATPPPWVNDGNLALLTLK